MTMTANVHDRALRGTSPQFKVVGENRWLSAGPVTFFSDSPEWLRALAREAEKMASAVEQEQQAELERVSA